MILINSLTTKIDGIKKSRPYNSIIKINDNKFGIIQISNNLEQIYIIIFNIFNNYTNIIARYYTMEIFRLYHMKVSNGIKTILFNSFFVGSFVLYTDNNDQNTISSVIMFSYPDSIDFEIDLINHLKNNKYDFPLNDIIQNKFTINNNIFGLVMKGIQIQSFLKYKNTIIISLGF